MSGDDRPPELVDAHGQPLEPKNASESGGKPDGQTAGGQSGGGRSSAAPVSPAVAAPSASNGGPEPKKPSVSPIVLALMALLALIGVSLVLAAWRIWPFDSAVVETNDAYVAGQVTVMAPQVSGYVHQLYVRDYQRVRRDQPLLKIDDRLYRQQVAQAKGQLDLAIANYDNSVQTVASDRAQLSSTRADLYSARAELLRAQVDDRRLEPLAARGSVSARERDQGLATLRQARANAVKGEASVRVAEEKIKSDLVAREGLAAQIETARAQLRLAEINLSNTLLYAPRDGQISDIRAREGQYLAAGSQVVFFVPPRVWVMANYKETQLPFMLIGQPVSVAVDALDGHRFAAHFTEMSPAAGSQFSVLKPDNATGNFTKIVQRVPLYIRLDNGQQMLDRLRPGMSVVVRIDTTSGRHRDRCYRDDPDRIGRSQDVGARRKDGSCPP